MRIGDRAMGWLGPIGVAVLAFVLRVWNVGYPNRLLFDETYYAKHAWSMLDVGYARSYAENADDRIAQGATAAGLYTDGPVQIAHPEAGKWMIAIGEHLFGLDAFGWRITAVVVGALSVLVLARLVRRLTGSTYLGCFAGLLLCFDGMAFVMSRLALLDGFLAFWVLCAVACLAADRDHMLRRVSASQAWLPLRPWQLVAGVCFGLAIGTKWSAAVALAAFGLLTVGWEVLARRRYARASGAEVPPWLRTTLVVGAPAFASLVVVALVVYVATWTGWLLHHDVYADRFDIGHGGAFAELWRFHHLTWDFHTGEFLAAQEHPYASRAWLWPVLDRPVAVDAQNNLDPGLCGAPADSSCMRVITLLGNPAVWWPGAGALLIGVGAWLRTRDPRLGLGLAGFAAGWLPWLRFDDRPIFSFYSVVMLPFTIIVVCVLVRMLLDRVGRRGRLAVAATLGVWAAVVVALFVYFHPVLTDDLVSYDTWRSRMWFTDWI